jgi:hypothetical protein
MTDRRALNLIQVPIGGVKPKSSLNPMFYCVKLHSDELHSLYSSPNIVRVIKSRRLRWAGHVARMWEERGVYRVVIEKPEGKRPLERPRRRWEDNINLDLRETGIDGANWIWLTRDRVHWRAFVNTVMNLRVT